VGLKLVQSHGDRDGCSASHRFPDPWGLSIPIVFPTEARNERSGGISVYAGHVPVLGGESPLRSRESEPLSEGKGVAVRRGLKEAWSKTAT